MQQHGEEDGATGWVGGRERCVDYVVFFFFQAEDGIRDYKVTGVQTCALPILVPTRAAMVLAVVGFVAAPRAAVHPNVLLITLDTTRADRMGFLGSTRGLTPRSEEHTSELQSPCNLVCRLLLEKKNKDRYCVVVARTHTDAHLHTLDHSL